MTAGLVSCSAGVLAIFACWLLLNSALTAAAKRPFVAITCAVLGALLGGVGMIAAAHGLDVVLP